MQLLQLLTLLLSLTAPMHSVELLMQEELPVGTEIGDVSGEFHSSGVSDDFAIFHSELSRGLVDIDAASGKIRVKARIDRETVCSTPTNAVHEPSDCIFSFKVHRGRNSNGKEVTVKVLDINDNAPSWTSGAVSVTFNDGDSAGVHKPLTAAVDGDAGRNGSVRYQLMNSGVPFVLKVFEGQPILEATGHIDREENPTFNMTLVGTDEGSPPLTGSTTVTVTVRDVNDHSPQFSTSFYTPDKPVYEDAHVGSLVLKLRATDKDDGAYGSVQFAMATTGKIANPNPRDYFKVHSDGRITIAKRLDYDTMGAKKFFEFKVIAHDSSPDPASRLTATASVSVRILDRIDELPSITVCFFPKGCELTPRPSVPENQPENSLVAVVTVRDPDTDDKVECSVISEENKEAGDSPLKLTRNLDAGSDGKYKFDLKTNRIFDREVQDRIAFAIACRDSSRAEKIERYTLTIEDKNDNPPIVKGPVVLHVVEEDRRLRPASGSLRRFVTDADAGINSQLTFRINPTDLEASRLFSVDNVTGVMTPKIPFDREVKDVYSVSIVVADCGQPSKSVETVVTVKIDDINDNAPRFDRSDFAFRVTENQRPFTRVGVVTATDADIDFNARIRYRLASDGTDYRAFTVNAQTGEISTALPLDRERQSHYSLTVVAVDSPRRGQRMTGSCSVSVTIDDANDNAPQFRITKQHPAVFYANKREPGNSIGQVYAEDADSGSNGRVVYELMNRAEVRNYFSVDRQSGLVLVNRALHDVPAKQFRLKVRACDSGVRPNCSAVAEFRVQVTDLKEANNRRDKYSGGSGERAIGHEIIIMCLSTMFLILGVATAVVVCLIVRRRTAFVAKKSRHQPDIGAATDAESEVKMISGTYDFPPAYKDFRGEDQFGTCRSHMQLRPTVARSLAREARYCTATPGVVPEDPDSQESLQQPQYQQLDGTVRLTRRPIEQRSRGGAAHMYYEISGAGVDDGVDRQAGGMCVDGKAASPLRSQLLHQHQHQQHQQQQGAFNPYTEASFV